MRFGYFTPPGIYCLFFLLSLFYSCNLFTKCENIQEWKIDRYRIVKSQCLGYAGGSYFPLTVYKGWRSIGTAIQNDDCTIAFPAKNDLYIIFDICKNKLTEIKPNKKVIHIAIVDSVQIFSNRFNQTKLLAREQIEEFIEDWNNSKACDYRDGPVDSVFAPTFQYKLTVYTKTGTIEFLGANFLISDRTHWTFYMNDHGDINYFNKLWTK